MEEASIVDAEKLEADLALIRERGSRRSDPQHGRETLAA
jgi:hypothetical protein